MALAAPDVLAAQAEPEAVLMPTDEAAPPPPDPRMKAWAELGPVTRALISLCDEPGLRTDSGARWKSLLRSLLEALKDAPPPQWWRPTWQP